MRIRFYNSITRDDFEFSLKNRNEEPDNKNHQMQQFDNEFVFITKNNTLSQQG